jgi:uncharacterized protein (DUF2236 family)
MTGAQSFEEYAADGLLVLGGAAAILLQLANPVVARGVAAHSTYATDPMKRLRNTMSYVYAVGLGSEAQTAFAARFVDRAHAGIQGATDAEHQLWVAATLYEVGRSLHEQVHGPLAPHVADEVYAASARLGTTLQLPDAAWPVSRDAFANYWSATLDTLDVTDDARRVANDLLHSRAIPWFTRPLMPLVRVVTAGLLPATVRDAYGLPHHPAQYRAAIGFVRTVVRNTPRRLRELPSRRLLARLTLAAPP